MAAFLRRNWGWVITATAFLHFFANYGFLYSYGQFLVIFKNEFNAGATLTGWLGTIPFGLTYLASPLSNVLLSRFHHRTIAVLGVVLCVVSLIVTSFMTSLFPMFFTFSLLYGLGINFVTVSSLNIVLSYFPEKNSARSVSIVLAGCNTGLLATNPLIFVLNAAVGWRNTFRIAACGVLVTGLASSLVFTKPGHDRSDRKKTVTVNHTKYESVPQIKNGDKDLNARLALKEKDEEAARKGEESTKQTQVSVQKTDGKEVTTTTTSSGKEVVYSSGKKNSKSLSVMWYPEVWVVASSLVVCSSAVSFFYMSLVNFLVSRGFSDETSCLVMTALGVSQVVGKAVVAMFGDHLPFPKVFLLVISNVIGAIQMGALLVARTLIPVVAIIIMSGFLVISVLDTIPHALSHQLFRPQQCVVSWTIFTSSMGAGYVLGALLGESIDRTGSYDIALYVCMGFFLTAALLCSFVPLYQACFASERLVFKASSSLQRCPFPCFNRHKTLEPPTMV